MTICFSIAFSRRRYINSDSPPILTGSAEFISSESVWLPIDVCGGGRLFDELGRFLRKRHIGHVARLHFDRLGLGALCHHALLIRIDRSVFGGHHVPGGLMLPCWILDLMGERVSRNRYLRNCHEIGL